MAFVPQGLDIFDRIVDNLIIQSPRILKYAYSIPLEKCIPEKRIGFWEKLSDSCEDNPEEIDRKKIHVRNSTM